jgi:hypothetical protein
MTEPNGSRRKDKQQNALVDVDAGEGELPERLLRKPKGAQGRQT